MSSKDPLIIYHDIDPFHKTWTNGEFYISIDGKLKLKDRFIESDHLKVACLYEHKGVILFGFTAKG